MSAEAGRILLCGVALAMFIGSLALMEWPITPDKFIAQSRGLRKFG
jgi:hypothetical protein